MLAMNGETRRMIDRLDPFALEFDSIMPGQSPGARAFDDPLLYGGLTTPFDNPLDAPLAEATPPAPARAADAPGFYLLDDAAGRFIIDHEIGVVSVSDDNLLTLEQGSIHPVRIRVVENSGASYELNFRLRITGRVPQMAGGEENDFLVALASPEPEAPPLPSIAWTEFRAFRAEAGQLCPLTTDENVAFGAPLSALGFPCVALDDAILALDPPPPRPAARSASWAQ